MSDRVASPDPPTLKAIKVDPLEAQLEAKEQSRYLLAKTLFDCREFDRCAAVFLPQTLPQAPIAPSSPSGQRKTPVAKGKARQSGSTNDLRPMNLSKISQKSLFLALYAKYMSGEKRKDEDSEMILGPADGGMTINKELNGVSSVLEQWFTASDEKREGQGWLEYLYGVVLSKGKNEELAKQWLLKSVHLYPYNWGAWQELGSLVGTTEEVRMSERRYNLHPLIFYLASCCCRKPATKHHDLHLSHSY